MKNTTAAGTSESAVSTSLRGLAALFPYKAANRERSEREYQVLSHAQKVDESIRRKNFHERLAAFRETGESLRSSPTFLSDPFMGRSDLVQADEMQSYFANLAGSSSTRSSGVPQQLGSSMQPPAASFEPEPELDPYPFDAPPIDCSAYADIPVDIEYDQTSGIEVYGPEGQPDVHDWSKATTGTITKIGFYPFRYKKDEKKTHMVRIGTRDHWGADLERVVREFKLKEGDNISLLLIGKQDVIVQARKQQADGSYKMEDVPAKRNTWACKRV